MKAILIQHEELKRKKEIFTSHLHRKRNTAGEIEEKERNIHVTLTQQEKLKRKKEIFT